MKLPQYRIWVDVGFGNDFAVIIVAKLSMPISSMSITFTVLESELIDTRKLPKLDRILKINKQIEAFKIKHNIPNEFIQEIQTR